MTDERGLVFGQTVYAATTLKRRERQEGSRLIRVWESVLLPTIQAGLFIGYRTLSHGSVAYGNGWDEPTTYHPEQYIRVALVVFGPRTNPVYVSLANIHHNAEGHFDD